MKIEQISKFTPLQTKQGSRGHAVIIGGSMAGLLAARALADHFERVTILERDVYPTGAEARRGLTQGHHLHALPGRCQKSLEEFPDPAGNDLYRPAI
jgi:glycine/D-amino acid oxidase-like deaminating enzyme